MVELLDNPPCQSKIYHFLKKNGVKVQSAHKTLKKVSTQHRVKMTQGHSRHYNSSNFEGLEMKLGTIIDYSLCYICMSFGFDW